MPVLYLPNLIVPIHREVEWTSTLIGRYKINTKHLDASDITYRLCVVDESE